MSPAPHGTSTDRDGGAVLALVLAFVLPPVGLVMGIAGRGGRPLSGLRGLAALVGLIGTCLLVLVAIMSLGGTTANR